MSLNNCNKNRCPANKRLYGFLYKLENKDQTKRLSQKYRDKRNKYYHEIYKFSDNYKNKKRKIISYEDNRNYMLIRRYGITNNDYLKMYNNQKGKCDICDKKQDILHVDHCHKSGKVRGLLCSPCNRSLGFVDKFNEKIERYRNG